MHRLSNNGSFTLLFSVILAAVAGLFIYQITQKNSVLLQRSQLMSTSTLGHEIMTDAFEYAQLLINQGTLVADADAGHVLDVTGSITNTRNWIFSDTEDLAPPNNTPSTLIIYTCEPRSFTEVQKQSLYTSIPTVVSFPEAGDTSTGCASTNNHIAVSVVFDSRTDNIIEATATLQLQSKIGNPNRDRSFSQKANLSISI